jgi:hypothetical protein
MNESENHVPQDGDDDRDIRALMRETDYSGRLSDDFKRDLLREINHNFRYHTLRSRVLPAAFVVLIAGTLMWWTTDVGSDGFSLRTTGSAVENGKVVEAPMTRTRLNAPALDGDDLGGRGAAESVYEQIEADGAKVLRVESWIVNGHTVHQVCLEVEHDGSPTQVMRTIGASGRFGPQWRRFRAGTGRALLDRVATDSIAPQSLESTRLFGRDFTMGVWTWKTSDFDTVVYKKSLQ